MLKEIVYSEKEMEGYMRKCNKCHGKSNVFPKSVPIFYNIDDDYYKIVVRNLLSYKFETCEDIVYSSIFFNKVEVAIHRWIV